MEIFNLSVDLLAKAALVVLIAFMIARIRITFITDRTVTRQDQLYFILIFGLLSVYGTWAGVKTTGAIVNVRDLAPMLAGLIGGPLAGVGAGLIGGAHRYFQGGFTAIPCAIGTVLSGFVAGMFYNRRTSFFTSIPHAIILGLAMMSFDMVLLLAIARPFADAFNLFKIIAIPMILDVTIGLVAFTFLIRSTAKQERDSTPLEF